MTNVKVTVELKQSESVYKPGSYFKCSQGEIVLCTMNGNNKIFSGVCIVGTKFNATGVFRNDWLKSSFKPFRGKITIEV